MLLKNNQMDETEYLKDWPAHYYEIPTGLKRKEALEKAEKEGFAVSSDVYRRKLCEKRFFTGNRDGTVDLFMRSWLMIKAAGDSGLPLFGMKKVKKELETQMENLCLPGYEALCQEERTALREEWGDFAERFIDACAQSRNYGYTLPWLGLGRCSDSAIAEKIAVEIFFITRDYPAHFGMEAQFLPLREVMCETYLRMIANAGEYLDRACQK